MTRLPLLVLLLAVTFASPPALAQTPEAVARERVITLLEAIHETRTQIPEPEARAAALRAAIADSFDLALWRRAVLGERAALFSEAQIERLDAALPGYLARLYLRHFAGSPDAAPRAGATRPTRRDILVEVAMPHASGDRIELLYRVRARDGEARVIDVIAGGVSFALMLREDFGGLIDREGAAELLAYVDENAI